MERQVNIGILSTNGPDQALIHWLVCDNGTCSDEGDALYHKPTALITWLDHAPEPEMEGLVRAVIERIVGGR